MSDGLSRFGVGHNDYAEWSSIFAPKSVTWRCSDRCCRRRLFGDPCFEMTSDAVDADEHVLGYLWCRRWGIGHGGILLGRALPLLTFGGVDMCPTMVAQGRDQAMVVSGALRDVWLF